MISIWRYAFVGVVSTCALVQAINQDDDDPSMGPAAFMWPSDRPWSADVDNIAPCGSSAGAGNRTNYPLSMSGKQPFLSATYIRTDTITANGRLALVLRDDISRLHVSVAYDNGMGHW